MSHHGLNAAAWATLICLASSGCESAPEQRELALDSSFVALDSGVFETDMTTDQGQAIGDMHTRLDTGLMDVSTPDGMPETDAAASPLDAAMLDQTVVDASAGDSSMRPRPTCGDDPFIDLNLRADNEAEYYVFSGRVGGNQSRGSCSAPGTIGADALHRFTAPRAGEWLFDTLGSDIDTVVYIRTACDQFESEQACNNDVSDGYRLRHSQARVDLNEGESVFVIVDSYHGLAESAYLLSVRPYRVSGPPAVTRVDAIDVDGSTLSLAIEGQFTDDPVVLVELESVFADNRTVRSFSTLVSVRRSADRDFGVIHQMPLAHEIEPPVERRVRVVDGSANVSAWTPVNGVDQVDAGGPGALCDGRLWRCDTGLICFESSCSPENEQRGCPADWRTRRLESNAFGQVNAAGDNSMAMSLRDGSCGGGTATQVFEVTVPQAGTYQVSVDPFEQPAFPVLYVRDFCNFDETQWSGELACSADGSILNRPNVDSIAALRVDLPAEQPTYVFVDSVGRANVPRWSGPYNLTIAPVRAPVIDSARVVFDRMANMIGVYVAGQDLDASRVVLRLYTADDQPIHYLDDDADWPVELAVLDSADDGFIAYGQIDVAGRISVRASRTLKLFVVDAMNLVSMAFEGEFVDPGQRIEGDTCDRSGLVDRCVGDGLVCQGELLGRCLRNE
ncbi:MAG: hypothetical protein CMH52_13505 [Myxococcales bacterium]|nr:hypothetical protein [Myxococcales bacterium]